MHDGKEQGSGLAPHTPFEGLAAVRQRFGWIVAIFLVVYLLSGITVIGPQELALVLRFGRLSGENAATQIHPPGILFALPAPMEKVIRVPIRREMEITVNDLGLNGASGYPGRDLLDPISVGYVLTGDQAMLHLSLKVKFRISDPLAFAMNIQQPDTLVADVVAASVTRVMGQLPVDDALRLRMKENESLEGAKSAQNLGPLAVGLAQKRLEGIGAGIQITAIEFKEVQPPEAVIAEFKKAQSARIDKETARQEALAFQAAELPKAESESEKMVHEAMAFATASSSRAIAEAAVFDAIADAYRQNPAMQKERLWREGMEEILHNTQSKHFLPGHFGQGNLRLLLSEQGVKW